MGHDCCNHNHDHNKPSPSNSLLPLQEGEIESVFKVSGVDCNDEVEAIKNALSNLKITSVNVNIIAARVTLRHSKNISQQTLIDTIQSTGVKVVEGDSVGFIAAQKNRIILITVSGIALSVGMFLHLFQKNTATTQLILFSIATVLAGILVFPKALRALKQRSLDMNVLMSAAVVGAFAIQEYSEAATVVFLFSLAELLEAFSIDRARRAIRDVLNLTPQTATQKQGDQFVEVSVSDLAPDDLIMVKPGENIPLDGFVLEGNSSVNQAPVTGESKLVNKREGDVVFAGTLNENGMLLIKVSKAFQDTKISKMMRLIEEAQESKAPSERFVDRFAKIYTPIVFVLALLTAFALPLILNQSFNIWFYRALVLLVIACPCALVLATPVSVVSGLASLAKRGVLVKGGVHLESLGKIKTIALDKTGTLTEGKFKVQSFKSFNSSQEDETLKIANALEKPSSHPLAKAILDYTSHLENSSHKVENYKIIAGRGAEAKIANTLYFVGNHRLAHELGVCTPELESYLSELESHAFSVVIVGQSPNTEHKGEVLGVFALGDSLRNNAHSAITELHKLGIENIVVLSGDNQKTVDAIKTLSGVDEAYGDLLPEDKVYKIKKLIERDKYVAMLGDGINDAPALAHATLGISMGAAGTDAAIETSDVALMQDNLSEVPKAIYQGRRVLSVIRFNIMFAIAIKAVFLVLAMTGISNLWLAVAADMGASLLVIANALRLLKIKS